ncbi:MAG TPA: PAS domain S-box protein [Candidatus Acidoferrales bacterium]|nr:PAS domain S-box protein [Candidatus Acidoferrales bacterium]
MTNAALQNSDPLDLRDVVETIPALVVCALPDGSAEFVNHAWQEYTGYPLQPMSGSGWQGTIHPDDLPTFLDEWSVALSAGKPFQTEARVQRADGQYRWFLVKKALAVLRNQNSKPSLHTLIAFEDIHERKQAQASLRQSEARYRVLVETANDAVVSADESGAIQLANPSTTRIFGYDASELIGKPLTLLMPELMRMAHQDDRCQADWQGMELTGLRKNGQEFPIEVSLGELIRDGKRVFTGFIRDVSEKKRAEEALRHSESYLAQAQRLAQIGSWAWQIPGRNALYLSEEWYRISSFDPKDGMPTWEERLQRVHPEDRARFKANVERAIAEKSAYDVEFRVVPPDTPIRFIHSVGQPVMSPSGQLLQFVGVVMDVTQSKQAEEERERLSQQLAHLAHLNRVGTMGELTASLAHEINQPIGAAVTNAQACLRFLERKQPDVAEAREAALEMARDASRAADIIERVRSLYRKGSSRLEMVEANEVIREMIDMLRDETNRRSVTMRTDLAEGLPTVMADPVQLQQVLMNLTLNGVEAMQDTGGELHIKSQSAEDGHVLISITDTGVGLPTEKTDQIFNAYFTTKPHGTGLGLAITRSIVESHGGRIWATPNSGPGATFQFTLRAAHA